MMSLRKSDGSVLVIALVLLTAMTLGAMVAMDRSTLQLRMVSNMQHQQEHYHTNYGNASFARDQLQATGLDTEILFQLNALEIQSVAAGNPVGTITINPYTDANLSRNIATLAAANIPTSVAALNAVMRLDDTIPSSRGNYEAKKYEGNSVGSLQYAYARLDSTSTDANNIVRSNQTRGYRKQVPAL